MAVSERAAEAESSLTVVDERVRVGLHLRWKRLGLLRWVVI